MKKTIQVSLDLTETSVAKSKIKETNQGFYTTDINSAYLEFVLSEEVLNGLASLVLINEDGSVIQKEIAVAGTTFSYMLEEDEVKRKGRWDCQIAVSILGTEVTAAIFRFNITGSLLDQPEAVAFYADNFNRLEDQFNEYLAVVELSEEARELAESVRVAIFEEVELERKATFEETQAAKLALFELSQQEQATSFIANQSERVTAFEAAQSDKQGTFLVSESDRRATFNLAETNRAETFHENETDRETYENARKINELNRAISEDSRKASEDGRKQLKAEVEAKLANGEFIGDQGIQGIQGEQGIQGIQAELQFWTIDDWMTSPPVRDSHTVYFVEEGI